MGWEFRLLHGNFKFKTSNRYHIFLLSVISKCCCYITWWFLAMFVCFFLLPILQFLSKKLCLLYKFQMFFLTNLLMTFLSKYLWSMCKQVTWVGLIRLRKITYFITIGKSTPVCFNIVDNRPQRRGKNILVFDATN